MIQSLMHRTHKAQHSLDDVHIYGDGRLSLIHGTTGQAGSLRRLLSRKEKTPKNFRHDKRSCGILCDNLQTRTAGEQWNNYRHAQKSQPQYEYTEYSV